MLSADSEAVAAVTMGFFLGDPFSSLVGQRIDKVQQNGQEAISVEDKSIDPGFRYSGVKIPSWMSYLLSSIKQES